MAGRPKLVFTEDIKTKIEELALINCNNNTIAEATGVAVNSLKRHFGSKLRHWRAEYRANLRKHQETLAKTSSDMAKFLGKNDLGQVDKQEVTTTIKEQAKLTEREELEYARLVKIRLTGRQETA